MNQFSRTSLVKDHRGLPLVKKDFATFFAKSSSWPITLGMPPFMIFAARSVKRLKVLSCSVIDLIEEAICS